MEEAAKYDVQLLGEALSIDSCRQFVTVPEAGAIVLFEGTVRSLTSDKHVERLEFEAYPAMAKSEMEKIAQSCLEQFEILRISIHHRTGTLIVGETPVVIAVGAAHRKAAFEACQFAIDTLKETVPIWKKEIFRDGEVWVAAHP